MERRAHWSDDLIEAVRSGATFEGTSTCRLHDHEVYAIIAAVEDWQRTKMVGAVDAASMMGGLASIAYANTKAIQRVRNVPKKVALARRSDVDNPQKLAWYQGWNDAIDAVFRALDGGAE